MKKILFALVLTMCNLIVFAQKTPPIYVNHFFTVLDSTDLNALDNSDFIKNQFAAVVQTANDNGTRSYIFGVDTYIELLSPSSSDNTPVGNASIGFGVDRISELLTMNALLKKRYLTRIDTTIVKTKTGESVIPFITVSITDTVLQNFNIGCWIMAYTPAGFDSRHLAHNGDLLTRTASLKDLDEQRENKILKNFTGITLRANENEKIYFENFLLYCGYKKMNDRTFASVDNFLVHFIPKENDKFYSLASADFESNVSKNDIVNISGQIQIVFHGKSGTIHFNKK